MENINEYLKEGEIILWRRSEVKNFFKYYPYIIFSYLILAVIIVIVVIIAISSGFVIVSILLISLFIGASIYILIYLNKDYKDTKNNLQLTRKELKNYEKLEILTNKRFIIKDYDKIFKTSLSKYSSQQVEQIKDILFLNLSCIDGIIVDHYGERIYFLIGEEMNVLEDSWSLLKSDFYITFKRSKLNLIKDVFEKLRAILKLELKEKTLSTENYVVKKNKFKID